MPPAASGASVKRSYTDAHKDSDKCRIDHRNSWTTHKTLANEGIWTLYVEVDICTSSHTGRPVTSATRRVTRPTTPSQLLHGPLQRKLASIYVYYRAPIKNTLSIEISKFKIKCTQAQTPLNFSGCPAHWPFCRANSVSGP